MSHRSNPFLPSDRAVDKQAGTDVRQRESREQFNQQRAEMQRKAKGDPVNRASHAESGGIEEGDASRAEKQDKGEAPQPQTGAE